MTSLRESLYIRYSSRWRPGRQVPPSRLKRSTRDWLLDPASLTHRLRQGRGVPRLDERRTLRLAGRQACLIREVRLLCHDTPWVFARTVIPAGTLTGRVRQLARLGSRPLGAVLFADPGMRREHFELCRLVPGNDLYAHATQGMENTPASIWGRRSVFLLDNKPLLVSEIFLDDLGPLDRHRPYAAIDRSSL